MPRRERCGKSFSDYLVAYSHKKEVYEYQDVARKNTKQIELVRHISLDLDFRILKMV